MQCSCIVGLWGSSSSPPPCCLHAQVLLADEHGALLEGLVSNFAVLAAPQREEQQGGSAASLVLQTAAVDQPALRGIGLQALLHAAERLGLPVSSCFCTCGLDTEGGSCSVSPCR